MLNKVELLRIKHQEQTAEINTILGKSLQSY